MPDVSQVSLGAGRLSVSQMMATYLTLSAIVVALRAPWSSSSSNMLEIVRANADGPAERAQRARNRSKADHRGISLARQRWRSQRTGLVDLSGWYAWGPVISRPLLILQLSEDLRAANSMLNSTSQLCKHLALVRFLDSRQVQPGRRTLRQAALREIGQRNNIERRH